MKDIVKIGMVDSPNYDGIRYQVYLSEVSGTVWIEIETGLIQVGENVDLDNNNPTFPNNFDDFYNSQGRRAGTYTFSNGRWSRQWF